MMPINVSYDSCLTKAEADAVIEGMEEFCQVFPGRIYFNYGAGTWCRGDYSSADWYIGHARVLPTKQINANDVLNLLQNEPWQMSSPHIDVLFTGRDLSLQGLNFVFGVARPSARVTVQSVARYRGLPESDRKLAIKTVVQHELGHILGCAHPGREKTEMNLGSHCTQYGCIMQQGLTVEAFVRHAKEARALNRLYCPLCLAEARRSSI